MAGKSPVCPVCDGALTPSRMANGNIMLQCKADGVQVFVRAKAGVQRFEARYPGLAPAKGGAAAAAATATTQTRAPESTTTAAPAEKKQDPPKPKTFAERKAAERTAKGEGPDLSTYAGRKAAREAAEKAKAAGA